MRSHASEEQRDKDDYMKKFLSTTAAFGLLRRELIENLGINRVRGFLFRYGWRLGASDAKAAMAENKSIDYLIRQASVLHLSTGQVGDIQSERQIEVEDDGEITFINGKGRWIDSFEAHEHMKHHGKADTPACHTLTGYANGYMSVITNTKIFVKETSCIAKGDEECIFETRLLADWGDAIEEDLAYFDEERIVDELEYSYEQLLEERNYITKVSSFHKEITQSVSNGSNLQDIANNVNKSLQIPITIEDSGFQNIAYAGMAEEEHRRLNEDFKEHLTINDNRKHKRLPLFGETTRLEASCQKRLITPIMVQRKIIGYCTFIYLHDQVESKHGDVQLINSAANAVSLILLNEKTSFEALEEIKGNLLERILVGDYDSEEEIINRGRYMGVDFKAPYYIAIMRNSDVSLTEKSLQDQNEQVLDTIAKYLDLHGINVLVGQYENRIVMYIPEMQADESGISVLIQKLYDHVRNTSLSCDYKIGVSTKGHALEDIRETLEKALIAIRMSNKHAIMHYSELGILGVLINSNNVEMIKDMAEKELGPIFEADRTKQNDLLNTLHVFLSNGGNLHQTMEDLALSMSGLTYRKNKIEKLLNKDLRDPSQSYQLLLILDSLTALEELTYNPAEGARYKGRE